MSEYWVSQAKKYCDFCKCWIADNKPSVAFHENGKKHKEKVEERLKEIRKKTKREDARDKQTDEWVRKMEENAMKDYRNKDLENNGDITAQLFNEKRAEREANREREEQERKDYKAAQEQFIRQHQIKVIPLPSSSNGFEVAGPDDHTSTVRRIIAPKSGTKWHNSPQKSSVWYEAVSDDGNHYFWNTETNESSWLPPPEGYTSIAEQEMIAANNEVKSEPEISEDPIPYKQQKFESNFVGGLGPPVKPDPLGKWETVQVKAEPELIDFQTPKLKVKEEVKVTLHSDRLKEFKEKVVPSLGGTSETTSNVTKPAIVFRKRKTPKQEFTRKTDDA